MEKKALRKKYLNYKNDLSFDYLYNLSYDISQRIFNTDEYKNAKNIFIYLSLEKEINTKFIIEQAIKDNKNIYCPVLTNNPQEMLFKKFYGFNKLYKNKFNILEPMGDKLKKSDKDALVIVPAILFNKEGYRIGFGGGYYDYFLSNNIYLSSFGLCLSKFIVPFKPEAFDKKVDFIITEKNIITTER